MFFCSPQKHKLASECATIRGYSTDDATAISKFWQLKRGQTACVDISYNKIVKDFKRKMSKCKSQKIKEIQIIEFSTFKGKIGWLYLQCKQMGWFLTSSSMQQPFGTQFPPDLNTDICQDVLTYDYDRIKKNVEATNRMFGGININVENIYITYGELDPWISVGASKKQGAVIIPKYSHCCDRGSINPNDTRELKSSKLKLFKLVREWLN